MYLSLNFFAHAKPLWEVLQDKMLLSDVSIFTSAHHNFSWADFVFVDVLLNATPKEIGVSSQDQPGGGSFAC